MEAAKVAGQDQTAQIAIERALHGEMVPTIRAGGFTGYKLVHNDRILMGVLNARRTEADELAAFKSWHQRLEKWEIVLRGRQWIWITAAPPAMKRRPIRERIIPYAGAK